MYCVQCGQRVEAVCPNHGNVEHTMTTEVRPSPYIMSPNGIQLECLFCGAAPDQPHYGCEWNRAIEEARSIRRRTKTWPVDGIRPHPEMKAGQV